MKRILLLLLAFCLCFCQLVSCAGGGRTTETDTQTDTETTDESTVESTEETTAPPETDLHLISGGTTEYCIIYADIAESWEKNGAKLFQKVAQQVTGVQIPVRDDFEDDDEGLYRQAKEIVIGHTNREDEFKPRNYLQMMEGYTIYIAGERLVIIAGSQAGMYFALSSFFGEFCGVDLENLPDGEATCTELTVPKNYDLTQTIVNAGFPYMDAYLSAFTIKYDSENYMQLRMAYSLQAQIKSQTGRTIPVSDVTPADGEPYLYFSEKSTDELPKGKWELEVTGDVVRMSASCYLGYEGIVHWFRHNGANGFYTLAPGMSLSGNFAGYLTEREASCAYAYTRAGDVRVMFNNVLFWNPNPTERNRIQAVMYGEYLPDVLGLQECNSSKRTSAGADNLATLLSGLGYTEAVDPRVPNSSSGGSRVTVDGKTFRTYYNNTPLFYNTATTKLIDAGYYWYENQVDVENEYDCGAGDCASKSLTWGVFETLAGDRYIAISTHMCTRSNGIRGKQAIEAVELITQLLKGDETLTGGVAYDYPLFFGGDFNGGNGDGNNMLYFLSREVGYVDIQPSGIASVYTSPTGTTQAYPSYTSGDPFVQKGGGPGAGTTIDHILLANGEGVDVRVFGVVVDECSLAGSDHLPMFVDFSFKK